MRGGKSVGMKRASTLRRTGIALLAIHFTWTSSATTLTVVAHSDHEDEQCEPLAAREQSIVVFAEKLAEGEESSVSDASENDDEGALQPIANVSENEPELAEPPKVAQVPTPADPVVSEEPARVSEAKQSEGKESETAAQVALEPAVGESQSEELATTAETEVISFNGITPGISKRINVLRTWGDPRSDDTQASELKYRFDSLPAVVVRFEDDRVQSIVVELEEPTPTSGLVEKLNLQRIRPATMIDTDGKAIAQVYPERGVVLRFADQEFGLAIASDDASSADSSPRVSSIVIQPIKAEPFLWRAEENSLHHFTNTIADLESALQMDRSLGDASVRLSEIQLKLGKAVTAERYAAEAVDLEPQNVDHRLQWAKCLRQLARYDRAVDEVRQVLETSNIDQLVRAQALNEMGLLASLGSKKVARRAMPLHSKAIEIADSLAVGDDPFVSRPAKQLLVEAHLAVAVEISVGAWQQKDEAVPQWIERASALAEALIAEDESYLPLRLQVAVSSLAAAANLEQPINPLLWIEEAEETIAQIKEGISDPLAASQYDWQLGLAYFHGSQIEHRRSEPESAIELGELADQQLAELAKDRDEMPDTSYLLGRLYFQIGAVHAVHYEDHLSACQWYDKAVNRLLNPVPVTTMAAPQQHGDALVSMGVSYWNQSDRLRAIEVTESGVELIEQAVTNGLLEADTLMVSYNNLSAMYEAQGEKEPAARYDQLAREITGSKVAKKPTTRKRR